MPKKESEMPTYNDLRIHFKISLLLGLLFAFPLQAQKAWLRADKDSVLVGERFKITLSAEHDPQQKAIFPPAPKAIGELELFKLESQRNSTSNGKTTSTAIYEVAAFGIDSLALSLPVGLLVGKDTTLLESKPLRLNIRSTVPADAAGIQDITDIVEFETSWTSWLWISLIVLILAGIFFYLWRRFKKQVQQEAPAPIVPERILTPYQLAIEKLEKLAQIDLQTPENTNRYFTELTDILRTYLEKMLHINALEMTSNELIQAMQHDHKRSRLLVNEDVRNDLKTLLELADLAKFADFQPPIADSQKALQQAKNILERLEFRTRPLEEETETPNPTSQERP